MLGEITAQTMKMQTYTDAIGNLLSTSVSLPPELLNETQGFIEANRQLGHRVSQRGRLHKPADPQLATEASGVDKAERGLRTENTTVTRRSLCFFYNLLIIVELMLCRVRFVCSAVTPLSLYKAPKLR
jgi:hypothetical protein